MPLNSVSEIVLQMEPPNEGTPASGSGLLIPTLSYNMPPPGTAQVQEWGVITLDSSGVIAANTRCEIKNFESYIWSLSQSKWVRLQATVQPNGAYYIFSGGGGTTSPISWRTESDGGESATYLAGYVIHFFGAPIYTLPASGVGSLSDIGAVFTTYQARLVLDNPAGADNLASAKFLAQSGCDFWAGSGGFGPPVPNTTIQNVAVGGGKWIYLNRNWRAVSFYTGGPSSVINASTTKYPASAWTETQLTNNPPPLDGMGTPAGSVVTPIVFDFETPSPSPYSPFTRSISHNFNNPTDTTHANYGMGLRILAGTPGDHAPDTGNAFWRMVLDGPHDATWYDAAQTRALSTDRYDRCECATVKNNYQAGTHTWYQMAIWISSYSAAMLSGTSCGWGQLNMHQYGKGGSGPVFCHILDSGGLPKFRVDLESGWADDVNTPAYQYNTISGFGFTGGAPMVDAIPAGAFQLNKWMRVIVHFYWSTGTDGIMEAWYQPAGSGTWTKAFTITGCATLQWPRTAGDVISNATYNANYAGVDDHDQPGLYRHYVTSPLTPPFTMDIDGFDNTAISLADAQSRYSGAGGGNTLIAKTGGALGHMHPGGTKVLSTNTYVPKSGGVKSSSRAGGTKLTGIPVVFPTNPNILDTFGG